MNVQNKSSRCLIVCLLWVLSMTFSVAFGVTEQVRISSNNDDAEERISDGDMYRDSSDLEFGYDNHVGGLQIVGMRFKNVDIPQGATINSAYIEFETDETDSGTTNLVIFGENKDNPSKFSNKDDNISDRVTTSASVNWTPSAWNTVNELHQTPDIKVIIQEIVNRTGWKANNKLVLIIKPGTGCTTSSCQRTAESNDGESGSAPLLVVNYTVGSSSANLTGNLTVDNKFEAYLSTDDSVEGVKLTEGDNWQRTYNLASPLTTGQEYYLHIKATDLGFFAGFLGEFKIAGTDHTFSNGQTTIDTNTSNWLVSTTGWENYQSVTAFGANGDSPWPWNRTLPDISDTAQWIWSSNNPSDKVHYFSTRIVTPSPTTPSPVAEYRFDELDWNGTPNEVINSSGSNYNGTAVGGITTATGKICNAASIPNNNSASIVKAVDTGVDLDTIIGSSGTISLWYKGDSAWNSGSDKRLFDATDGNKYFIAEISNGKVKFWFEDGDDGDYQKTTVSTFSVSCRSMETPNVCLGYCKWYC